MDVHIRDQLDVFTPLHSNQYAYRKGKSTVGALHYLVKKIEGALSSKEIALCAFLDIEGAFDNTGYDSITRAISSRGIEESANQWVRAMSVSRSITSSYGGVTVFVTAAKGCPQGGVLSPCCAQ